MARVDITWSVVRRKSLAKAYTAVAESSRIVLAQARILTAHGPYSRGGPDGLSASLRREIDVLRGGKEVRARIWSTKRYARIVHDGAAPHTIRPRVRGRRLRFYWRRVGRVVAFRSVHHPGQQGQFFLTKPLVTEAARRRFRVTIH